MAFDPNTVWLALLSGVAGDERQRLVVAAERSAKTSACERLPQDLRAPAHAPIWISLLVIYWCPLRASPLDPPEYPLNGRYELALRWTPSGIERLLDVGCAWGYGTHHFTLKSRDVVGLEPNSASAAIFRARYPHLQLVESTMESIPLEPQSFDVIVALDVLEHVQDEGRSLTELYRLLKTGGVLITATPHRGAFGFLDRENLAPRAAATLARYAPWAYRALDRFRRRRDPPTVMREPPGISASPPRHRHYSLKDLRRLLDDSPFRDRYEITEVFRSGLFLEALTMDLALLLGAIAPKRRTERLLRPLAWLAGRDYWISYGPLSYNIALRLVKTG